MQIHSGVGMFHRAGRFPAAEGIELPLSSEAVQFYKSGQPFLQQSAVKNPISDGFELGG